MHIVQVEIDNFKSFSRKTRIPFFEGFTVVSGPNGSGKSNIIDAVLFVLSLSSSRNLRADNMTDFINNTSGKNTAEVTLEFSDGTRIRRRIKQTPTTVYSYYYLNEKTSSQAEILDFLVKNGIRPHGYNVVMQGDINRIMSMGDTERRGIIDNIAGVAEFDEKKDRALEELDQVRAKIEREELLLEEYARQLADLAGAREDAVKYVNLTKELDYLNAAKKSADIKKLESELSVIASSRAGQETLLLQHQESIKMEENERDARREEVADLDKKIAEKQGPEYLKIVSGQEEQKTNIRVAEESIARRKKDKETVLARMNDLYTEIHKYQNSFNGFNKQAQTLQIDRANLAMELETQKKVLAKAEEVVAKRSKDSQGAQAELAELMGKIGDKKDARSAIIVQRDGIIEKSRIRMAELERYDREQASLAEERKDLQIELDALTAQEGDAKAELKVIVGQTAEAERRMMQVKKNIDAVRNEIARLTRRQMQIEAEQKASGASDRALDAVSGFDGVHGTISKLGKVLKAEHTVALNIAAGARLNNVITEDDQVAADCIGYLKEERLGRLTFLPLNKMKQPQPLPPLAGNGVIDYAINLIDFKPEFRDAFSLVFGQTVVVENLDAGRRLMGRYRMVTLEGELLDKGGSMTGGSINKKIRGFGVAAGRESVELAAKIEELKAEEADLLSSDKRNESVCAGLREEKNAKDSEITSIALRISNCNRTLNKIAEDEAASARLRTETENDSKERAKEIASLETEIQGISDEIEALNKRMEELRVLVNEDEFNLLTEQLQKAHSAVNDAQHRLEKKESDLNGVLLERKHFKDQLDEKTKERTGSEQQLAEYDADIGKANADIEAARAAIRAFEERMKSFTGEIEELSNERARVQNAADEAQLKIGQLQGEVERCNVQINAFDAKSAELSEEIAAMKGSVDEEVECDLSLNDILDKIITTERAIKRLGNVNQQAIEQYDELEKKTAEKTEKKDTLSREREAILAKIEGFKQMKHDAFMTAYNVINENFKKIYRLLNDGSGQLVLDDYEDPFTGGMTFEVSPKGKEVHRLKMMSGGEKSLTTLSFIFAIQQHMPAPFYALDEVDSNLDGVNVERLSQMVREICENSQFIIVSHRKPMIEAADRMMGVTVRPGDKSTLVTGVKLVE
ncbi:MAG TPA: chromosome segregation protein SMC [Methanocorpusculum sp.]|nr:chromosome segregation protein SMC [Methanocorpusculum sp.]